MLTNLRVPPEMLPVVASAKASAVVPALSVVPPMSVTTEVVPVASKLLAGAVGAAAMNPTAAVPL